jgi:hypothetical protein
MSQALPFRDAEQEDLFSGSKDSPTTIPYSLRLELDIQDAETIQALNALRNERERNEFACQALRIGVLALGQARGEVDSVKIRRESERLIEAMDAKLNLHTQGLNDRLAAVLKDYFDPESGRFQERIERLIKKDGDLEQIMRKQVGAEDSELCRALSSHLGAESQLMQMLNPDQSKGLMAAIKETLDGQLTTQREHVLNQFSLDNKEGALCRFIGELTENQGQLSETLNGKIDEVVKEFSLDSDDSALSRLVRNVDRAQRTITNEFSLDEDNSALSRLKRMMEDTNSTLHSHLSLDDESSALARLKKELIGLLSEQSEKSLKFQEEVKGSLNAMIVKRDERNKSTRHGDDFEAAVCEFLFREAQGAGDIATPTGGAVGLIKNCKKGDSVIELGPDNACAGAKIVVEAKEDKKYTLASARAELDEAKKNRDAGVGVFVFSSRTAPDALDPLNRYGDDVFVVWDAEDPNSDIFLKAGMTLARALCIRTSSIDAQEAVDFAAIDKSILEIEKQANLLGEIDKWSSTIISNGEKIKKRVTTSRQSMDKQIEILRDKVTHLKEIS